MADKTKIEWTDSTWNPITGCTPCSPGCERCYARTLAGRFPQVHGFRCGDDDGGEPTPADFSRVMFHRDRLNQPMHWRRPRRVFVCSMGDIWHPEVPEAWREHMTNGMDRAPQHTYMLLTKRAQRMYDFTMPPRPNLWLGVTVCNRAELPKLDALRNTPAALRFVSFEPLLDDLGTVDLRGIGWVICGGETGTGARPMLTAWAHDLCRQCVDAGVPFFFKGWGTHFTAKTHPLYRVLDGRKWNEFPTGKEG